MFHVYKDQMLTFTFCFLMKGHSEFTCFLVIGWLMLKRLLFCVAETSTRNWSTPSATPVVVPCVTGPACPPAPAPLPVRVSERGQSCCSELRELTFSDDSTGLALDRFLDDYLLQSELGDDKDSSESEIIEEESEDDRNSWVTDATVALDQAKTHLSVIVVDTESSTKTEFAKVITWKLIHNQQTMST